VLSQLGQLHGEIEARCEGEETALHLDLQQYFEKLRLLLEAQVEQHASVQERLGDLEDQLGDAAGIHSEWEASLASSCNQLSQLHSEIEERCEQTGLHDHLSENFDKLRQLLQAQGEQHVSVEERLAYLEDKLGESTDMHAKWEAAHEGVAELLEERTARAEHDAAFHKFLHALQERIDIVSAASGGLANLPRPSDSNLQERVELLERRQRMILGSASTNGEEQYGQRSLHASNQYGLQARRTSLNSE